MFIHLRGGNGDSARTSARLIAELARVVLMAIGKDKTNPYFVRIVVDKTTKEVSEISTYGLYAIKAKKEGAHFMPEGNEAVGDENRLSPYLRSKVSIAQVLEDVKGISIANEVFSEDVAKRLGVRRTIGSLSNDLRYSPAQSGSGRIVIQASQSRPTGREKLTNLKGELSRSNFRAALFNKTAILHLPAKAETALAGADGSIERNRSKNVVGRLDNRIKREYTYYNNRGLKGELPWTSF